jgi:DNA-binding IclR family transcriptional regulator
MSPELQSILQLLARRGALPATDVATALALPDADAARLLDDLVAKGHVGSAVEDGVTVFRAQFGRRRARAVPEGIWQALTEKVDSDPDES